MSVPASHHRECVKHCKGVLGTLSLSDKNIVEALCGVAVPFWQIIQYIHWRKLYLAKLEEVRAVFGSLSDEETKLAREMLEQGEDVQVIIKAIENDCRPSFGPGI